MTTRDNEERQFLEDIELLLKGEEPAVRLGDADYNETVLLARRLIELRQEPGDEFAGRLKRNLATRLAEEDARAQDSTSWFMRLFGRPGLGLAVVSTFVVLAAVGLVWRVGLLSPSMPQSGDVPPGMLTAPAAPTVASSEPDAGSTEMMRGQEADPSDKGSGVPADAPAPAAAPAGPVMAMVYVSPTAAFGEGVSIAVVYRNEGPDGYSLSPFPPGIVIREMATGHVVRTFRAGTDTSTISAMQSIQYVVVWNQEDASGRQVQSGRYQVEMEYTEARSQDGEATVSAGATGMATFEILARTTDDADGIPAS